MRGMHDHLMIAVYALAGLAAVEAGALAFVGVALTRSRREVAELQQRVDPRRWLRSAAGRPSIRPVMYKGIFNESGSPQFHLIVAGFRVIRRRD
jgi:hypothetical protein